MLADNLWPRGGRVVWLTEKRNPGSSRTSRWASVVLPVPDGAESTNGIPQPDGKCMGLFYRLAIYRLWSLR